MISKFFFFFSLFTSLVYWELNTILCTMDTSVLTLKYTFSSQRQHWPYLTFCFFMLERITNINTHTQFLLQDYLKSHEVLWFWIVKIIYNNCNRYHNFQFHTVSTQYWLVICGLLLDLKFHSCKGNI